MVECDLAKVEVAGSNPVSRSIFFWRHSQVVRQRSAKPLFSGSNPDAASIRKDKGLQGFQSLVSLFLYFTLRDRGLLFVYKLQL